MSSGLSEARPPVQAQIEQANEHLTELERDLHEIDRELEEHAMRRKQFELLGEICDNLDNLSDIGAAELFWVGLADTPQAIDHMRDARAKIESFHQKIELIEARRQALLDGMKEGQDVLDILEDDLLELQIKEEEKAAEWIVERDLDDVADPPMIMPWAHRGDDDSRFRKSLATSLLICLVLGLVIPLIDIPILQRDESYEVPERFAELIREEPRPIPPAEPVSVPEPDPVEPEIAEEVVEEEPVLAEDSPVEEPEVEPVPTVAQEPAPVEDAPRSTGILAFRESFAELASSRPSAQLGTAAQINDAGDAAVGRTERAMVTTDAPGSSGGINIGSLSRDVGGGGAGGDDIGGVALSRVASSIGGTGTAHRPLAGGSAAAGRTDEEIQIVFDRYKAALYRLYNRALRNDPTLRGQIVLHLTIEPDGSVSFCEVQTSDMDAAVLEQQVVDRVLTFDFGAKENIPAITIFYPIDFLPAA
ncbi:MAG: AgmX/PglI C-terminal domain-containing protein [Gammaproteobacteria bacterium]|nr:AgmX/PglI C-terminal domain-containing protein [Gammaproteobacteria bacterium]